MRFAAGGRGPNQTKIGFLVALSWLAGCASPAPGLLPVVGPPGPALALAAFEVRYTPTASLPSVSAGQHVARHERLLCLSCGDEQEPLDGACTPCDCGAKSFRPRFSRPFRPAFDPDVLRTRLVETLATRGSFARVEPLAAPDPSLTREAGSRASREAARAQGLEWLLEVSLDDARTVFVEKNGLHAFKIVVLIVSSILIFPGVDPLNWFLPGEDYAVRLSGEWTLRDAADGAEVARGLFDAEHLESFAAFGLGDIKSRNFFVVGFMRAPGCLDEDDWSDVTGQLEEGAVGATIRALVTQVEKHRPGLASPQ